MRTRKKWLWVILIFSTIVLVAIFWSLTTRQSAPILTLPNGDQYRFMGITHGTNGVPPVTWARIINRLPDKLSAPIRKKLGTRIPPIIPGGATGLDHYWAWFERVGHVSHAGWRGQLYSMAVADDAGNVGGTTAQAIFNTNFWTTVVFNLLPHRSRDLQLCFYPSGTSAKGNTPAAKITVPNPFFGEFPQWTPESQPAVKKFDDVEVRLDNVSIQPFATATLDQLKFQGTIYSPENATWVMEYAELSDATSNSLRVNYYDVVRAGGSPNGSDFQGSFPGPLWPGEAAWRIKLGFKRASGSDPAETFAINDVSLPAMRSTNKLIFTNAFGVMDLEVYQKMVSFGAGSSRTVESTIGFRLETPGISHDSDVTCIRAGTDAGPAQIFFASSHNAGAIGLGLRYVPTNAQTISLTFAVQKSQTVEFLVKPPK